MENLTKYLEDPKFIKWVVNPDNELNIWWKNYQKSNSGEKQNIKLAKKIIQKLQTTDKNLSDNGKTFLFNRIMTNVDKHLRYRKIIGRTVGFVKYAAIAIVFFSLGVILFHQKENYKPHFTAENLSEPMQTDEAMLIRSDGVNILLTDKKSVIEHRKDGNVLINNRLVDESLPLGKEPTEMNQLVIPYGKMSELTLPDGTFVCLNAGSRLIYPTLFTDKTREVFLVGEAFFIVKHDKLKPFVVKTTDLSVRVMGTRFNISAYSSDNVIETVLTEGLVKLEHNNAGIFSGTTELKTGQLATFDKATRTTQVKTVDTEPYILWKDGLYKFESTDLSRVIKKLERYFNIRFNYENPFLGSIKISGKLELTDSRETVLESVSKAASVNITKIRMDYYEISK
jgi:hypothetical protein